MSRFCLKTSFSFFLPSLIIWILSPDQCVLTLSCFSTYVLFILMTSLHDSVSICDVCFDDATTVVSKSLISGTFMACW